MRTAAALVAALIVWPAVLRAQAPAGPEMLVSTSTTDLSTNPAVATADDGRFVVVWRWSDPFFRGGLKAQRYDAHGARLGGEFQVCQYTTTPASYPSVAADANGFTVAWWQPENSNRFDVGARRFSWDGTPLMPQFRVNASTTSGGGFPDISSDASGNFVVVWPGPGPTTGTTQILGQRFDVLGQRRGAEFAVGTPNVFVSWSSVAADAAGDYVVAWEDLSSPATGIFMRRFAADGTPLEAQVQLATGSRRIPQVARAPSGDFVVAWYDLDLGAQHRLVGRKFRADGTAATPLLALDDGQVETGLPFYGLAMDAQGRFYTAWSDAHADPSLLGVVLRGFEADGTPRGAGVVANTTIAGDQWMPALAATPAGHLSLAWGNYNDLFGPRFVSARRYGLLDAGGLRVDTAAGASSNGNGVLEAGESADFRPTWRNNSAQALAIDGTLVLGGPPPGTYVAEDPAGSYGTIAAGSGSTCVDCYMVRVTSAQRPSLHWDATATEALASAEDGQYPWALHVGDSFPDVPRSSPFYRAVETLLHRGITAGCSASTYCPAQAVTRQQMAVFVLRSREISRYLPPYCTFQQPHFPDVPDDSPFCPWVEELARRGITGGCGGGYYCPNDPVTREQMAVFLLRTLDPALDPPACATPVFGDVPASSPFCRWIEELARRGITAGCGGGNFCPGQPVTREQMAVFLATTFGLTLYGP